MKGYDSLGQLVLSKDASCDLVQLDHLTKIRQTDTWIGRPEARMHKYIMIIMHAKKAFSKVHVSQGGWLCSKPPGCERSGFRLALPRARLSCKMTPSATVPVNNRVSFRGFGVVGVVTDGNSQQQHSSCVVDAGGL